MNNVLYAPMQSIVPSAGKQLCYVLRGIKAEPQEVHVGQFNDEFIEIKKGLKEGDRVLLHPPESAESETGDKQPPEQKPNGKGDEKTKPEPPATTTKPAPSVGKKAEDPLTARASMEARIKPRIASKAESLARKRLSATEDGRPWQLLLAGLGAAETNFVAVSAGRKIAWGSSFPDPHAHPLRSSRRAAASHPGQASRCRATASATGLGS